MIAQVNGDPWIDAWGKLKACIRSGASEQEATEYAPELGRGLPDACDPAADTQQADAVQWIVRGNFELKEETWTRLRCTHVT